MVNSVPVHALRVLIVIYRASYALKSERCKQVDEKFDGKTYSRIHRATNGDLILEERKKGSMYPSCWLIVQDFSEMETAFAKMNN